MLIFLPKSSDQNFEITILFNIVEKSNNYVFEDELILYSPRKGCKFRTLHIVQI